MFCPLMLGRRGWPLPGYSSFQVGLWRMRLPLSLLSSSWAPPAPSGSPHQVCSPDPSPDSFPSLGRCPSCSGAEQVSFGFSPNKLINVLVTNTLQGHLTSVSPLSSVIIFQLLLQQQKTTKKRNGRVNKTRKSQRLGLWLAQ